MIKTFELTFADGYKKTCIKTFDELIASIDKDVQKHGDCIECIEEISYDKYTGSKYKKIW